MRREFLTPLALRGLRRPSCRIAVKRLGILSCPLPASRVRRPPSVRLRARPSVGIDALGDAPRSVDSIAGPSPGSLDLAFDRVTCHRTPRSAIARSPPVVELPRPPFRASDPSRFSEKKLDESSTPSGDLDGLIHGLRAHITAPKSSSVNPTHLQSPKRLSVSSSLRRGPERPLDKPPTPRDRAPKNLSTNSRTSVVQSSETLVFNP